MTTRRSGSRTVPTSLPPGPASHLAHGPAVPAACAPAATPPRAGRRGPCLRCDHSSATVSKSGTPVSKNWCSVQPVKSQVCSLPAPMWGRRGLEPHMMPPLPPCCCCLPQPRHIISLPGSLLPLFCSGRRRCAKQQTRHRARLYRARRCRAGALVRTAPSPVRKTYDLCSGRQVLATAAAVCWRLLWLPRAHRRARCTPRRTTAALHARHDGLSGQSQLGRTTFPCSSDFAGIHARALSPRRGPGEWNLTVHGFFFVCASRVRRGSWSGRRFRGTFGGTVCTCVRSNDVTHSRAQPRVLILPTSAPKYTAPKSETHHGM